MLLMGGKNCFQMGLSSMNQFYICSDHATIIYDTNFKHKGKHRPYQFENWCLTLPEIRDMIVKLWPTSFHGSPSFVF